MSARMTNGDEPIDEEVTTDGFIIHHRSGELLLVTSENLPAGLTLEIDLTEISTIAPKAVAGFKLYFLTLTHGKSHDTPAAKNIAPDAFNETDTECLKVHRIKFPVNPNPFRSCKSVTSMTLDANGFGESFPVDFFADFPELQMLFLNNQNLTTVSPRLFSQVNQGLTHLAINHKISHIEPGTFERLKNLEFLELTGGHLPHLRPSMFSGLPQLDTLNLSSNGIRTIDGTTFHGLHMKSLLLDHNEISELPVEVFRDLPIKHLDMCDNKLETIPKGLFDACSNIRRLFLMRNKIRVIETGTFENFSDIVEMLNLAENEIDHIEPGSFAGTHFRELCLANNKISVLQRDTFEGVRLRDGSCLVLEGNNITTVQPGALKAIQIDEADNVHLVYPNFDSQFPGERPDNLHLLS